MALAVTTDERSELERGVRSRKIRAEDARRAQVIPDLARKIRRYITRYNEDPKPVRWTYSNPAHRITTHSANTLH